MSQRRWPDVFLSEVAQMLPVGLYDTFGNLNANIAQVTAVAQYALRLNHACVEACRVIGLTCERVSDLKQPFRASAARQRAAKIGISEEMRRRLNVDKAMKRAAASRMWEGD